MPCPLLPSSSQQLSPEEIETVFGRLHTAGAKTKDGAEEVKIEHVQLKYDEQGREVWSPVKQTSYDEQKDVRIDGWVMYRIFVCSRSTAIIIVTSQLSWMPLT